MWELHNVYELWRSHPDATEWAMTKANYQELNQLSGAYPGQGLLGLPIRITDPDEPCPHCSQLRRVTDDE